MAYTKQSLHDDDQLRLAAKSLIVLRNEKLAAIAKALQFDPGGISGWLGGTPNRMSLEKKEILSTYLGLEYTHISPKTVHRWSTNAEDVKTLIPLVINPEMLQRICISLVSSDTIPVGCIYHATIGNTTLVALCKAQNKAFPIPAINPEDSGWGTQLSPIEVAKSTWDSWWSDQRLSPEKIAAYLSISQRTINSSVLESWASLLAELIERGADIDSVRQCLETNAF
ncbi:MAG: hypothetical protein ACYDC7_00715 [Acidithiobacillus ferrivorans]